MNNTDGYPAPEARVRAYLEAQAEEDARTGTASDEIAWAVSDENGLVALAIGDLRDVLREFDAERAAHAETRRGRDRRPLATADTYRDMHPSSIADIIGTTALEERYHTLTEFYAGRASRDPRCGCSADNEGGRCYWDDPEQIDEELGRRRA